MTMYNHLPDGPPALPLLQPQSQSLIDFDFVLLTHLWGQIAPPTPVAGYMPLLELLDRFAEKPHVLRRRPAERADDAWARREGLHGGKDWDAYPVVGFLLDIWDITGEFVTAVVDDLYPSDDDVAKDEGLKAWMTAAGDPDRRQRQGTAAAYPDARRARESADEHPVPRHRARGRKSQPGGEPGAVVRRELPAVSSECRHSRAERSRDPGTCSSSCRTRARSAG